MNGRGRMNGRRFSGKKGDELKGMNRRGEG